MVGDLDVEDAEARYREEEADNKIATEGEHRCSSSSSIEDERIIVSWAENDPANPYNWSFVRPHTSDESRPHP